MAPPHHHYSSDDDHNTAAGRDELPSYAQVPLQDPHTAGHGESEGQHPMTMLEAQQAAGPPDPPPGYEELFGHVDLGGDGRRGEEEIGGRARVTEDGRVNININKGSQKLAVALRTQFRLSTDEAAAHAPAPGVPESLRDIPPLNVLIQIIGSRGDVQPFIALGRALKAQHGHRVRVATHPVFKSFVEENGLEFFSLGGDPSELMAFMVKNPGLVPGIESLRNGDVGKRRKGMWEVLIGGWRACIEAGDGMGGGTDGRPFVADAIIANPPSFAHVHCAEKLGVPLHLMFTMPWSPTTSFPHPLANIQSTNADKSVTNFLSYVMVEILTWQGLGDLVNKFREQTLGLAGVSTIWAPGAISRLRVPYTYCWSPALIPKPQDWGPHIGISGFYFLSLANNYNPPPELAEFLANGPPPVYIGFGSIVVSDPNAMTQEIFRAVELAGCRAVVSKGWGGIGGASLHVPPNIFLLDNCPHDWLFPRCAAVVHHGGAGTTAAGIRCGKPTVVVPFFGDQAFWGNMIFRAGAGPEPLPHKQLTAESLAEKIAIALSAEAKLKAAELGRKVCAENGVDEGVKEFHRALQIKSCDILPDKVAVWRTRKGGIKLSAVAAAVVVGKGLVENEWDGLRLCRHREWAVDEGPIEPLSGGASALMGTIGSMMGGVSDMPRDVGRIFVGSSKGKERATGNQHYPQDQKPHGDGAAAVSTDSINTAVTAPSSPLHSPPPPLPPGTSSPRDTLSPPPHPPSVSRNPSSTTIDSNPSSPRPTTPTARERFEIALTASGGINKIVSAGLRSPLDFTLGLAQGFRNAPRLYNDTTVRPHPPTPTGLQSGLKIAGKEFAVGLYDGVTGLVTQPYLGAKTGGVGGAVKGFGKGAVGLVLKGGAGMWGLPAYAFQGIHAEVLKLSVKDVDKALWSARMRQGIEEAERLDEHTLNEIVRGWEKQVAVAEKKRSFFSGWEKEKGKEKAKGKEKEKEKPGRKDQRGKRTPSFSNVFANPDQKQSSSSSNTRETGNVEDHRAYYTASSASEDGDAQERELIEEAIRRSVAETSHGNATDDAEVEAAIRASLMDPDIAEAMRLSLQHAQQEQREQKQQQNVYSSAPTPSTSTSHQPGNTAHVENREDTEDRELQEAMRLSMIDATAQHHAYSPSYPSPRPSSYHQPPQSYHQEQPQQTTATAAPEDEDEDLAEAIRRSLAVSQNQNEWQQSPHTAAVPSSSQHVHTPTVNQNQGDEEDEDLKRALAESLKTANIRGGGIPESSHLTDGEASGSGSGGWSQPPPPPPPQAQPQPWTQTQAYKQQPPGAAAAPTMHGSGGGSWSGYVREHYPQYQDPQHHPQQQQPPAPPSYSSQQQQQQQQQTRPQPARISSIPRKPIPTPLSPVPSRQDNDDDEFGTGYTPPPHHPPPVPAPAAPAINIIPASTGGSSFSTTSSTFPPPPPPPAPPAPPAPAPTPASSQPPNPRPQRTRTWGSSSSTLSTPQSSDDEEGDEDWEQVERAMRESLEEQERKRRDMERALAEVVAKREAMKRRPGSGRGREGGASGSGV